MYIYAYVQTCLYQRKEGSPWKCIFLCRLLYSLIRHLQKHYPGYCIVLKSTHVVNSIQILTTI